MTILITGCAGFIGSHLAGYLLETGNHKIIGIDNFDAFYDNDIKLKNIIRITENLNFTLIKGDLRDTSFLDSCFMSHNIDIVIHLAAKAGVRPSIINPKEYYDVNINGTLNLLEVMKKYNVKKMLFASSSSVYGNNDKLPFTEHDFVDHPISPYAASKKAGELLCHTYSHLYGFDIFCLRFFTVYGPCQRPDMAIHKFINNILNDKPISMFGNGETIRDYTFIDDIIKGIVAAMSNLKGFDVFNLGESKTISLIELIKMIESLTGKKAIIEKKPMQVGDVEATYADISKARKLLGYNPKFSMRQGLSAQIKWMKS